MMKTIPKNMKSITVLLLTILIPFLSFGQLRSPLVSSDTLRNYCPANTSNLNHVLLSTPATGQSIQWYSNPTRTGGVYSSPAAAVTGTYYAFLHDNLSNTYSEASRPVQVINTACTSLNSTNLPCNQLIPLTSDRFSNLEAGRDGSSIVCNATMLALHVGSAADMINADLNDFTSTAVPLNCGLTYSVRNSGDIYNAGTYAGFKIGFPGLLGLIDLGLGLTVTVSTYRNGNEVESQEVVKIGPAINTSIVTESTSIVGFISSAEFDEIKITYNPAGLVYTTQVFYPVIGNFCGGPDLLANVLTPINNPVFPTHASWDKSGLVCLECEVSGVDNVVSPSKDDFATLSIPVGVGNTASLSVKDVKTTYDAGTFSGFTIAKPSVLNLELLNSLKIVNYRNGTAVDSASGASLISLGSSLLGSSGKHLLGFISTQSFDEVKLKVSGLASVLNSVRVYEAVLQRFEDGDLEDCNTITSLINPDFPMAINPDRTKITGAGLGACLLCGVDNEHNVINEHVDDYAAIKMGATALDLKGTFSVKNQTGEFPQGTFAGFELENNTILDLSILEYISIKAYRNNVVVDSSTGPTQLLSLNLLGSSLSGKNMLGFVPNQAFDEIVLEVRKSPLVSVDLSEIRIYRAVANQFCSPTLECDSTYSLSLPDFPVMLNHERTGYTGLLCGLTNIDNAMGVISGEDNNPATISLPVSVGCEGAISVKSYETLFPAGSRAGFVIKTENDFLQLDLLPSITIQTYRNDTLVNILTLSSLLNIELLGILSNERTYRVFLRATEPFDEVRIAMSSLSSVLNPVLVHNSFVDTRGAFGGDLDCCSLDGFVPQLSVNTESNICPDETVDLTDNLSNTCPEGSELQFHNVGSGFSGTSIIANSLATISGQYYAVCFDSLANCYSSASSPVNVTVEDCCPVITNNPSGNTNPTICGENDGQITICGLKVNYSGYEVRYTRNGDAETVIAGLTSNSSGCLVLSNLLSGSYSNVKVYHEDCLAGSNSLAIVLDSLPVPLAPTAVSVSSTSVCLGQTVTLSATCASGTLAWYSNAELTNVVTSPVVVTNSTTYYAVCESGICKGPSSSVLVNVEQTPASPLNLMANGNDVCDEFSTSVTADCGSGVVRWYIDSNLTTLASVDFTPLVPVTYYAVCELGSCRSLGQSLVINPNTPWLNGDCDGDGVTNEDEIVSSGITDPVTDYRDPCDYNEAEQNILNVSQVWKDLDCDRDGNPNDPDPHPKVPVALNDTLTALYGVISIVNIMANDDFLPGLNTSLSRISGIAGGTASGAVSFAPLTGEMQYSPAVTEGGTVQTLIYQVCNIAVTPQVCTTATVTITVPSIVIDTCKPDFNPSISVIPSNGISGQQDMLISLSIKEIANCAANGITDPIRIVIPKVSQFSFVWSDYASSVSIPSVGVTGLKNADWTYTEDTSYWIWTYNKNEFSALDISKIAFLGTWNAGSTGGKVNFSVTIISTSEGGINIPNNVDQEVINFNAVNP